MGRQAVWATRTPRLFFLFLFFVVCASAPAQDRHPLDHGFTTTGSMSTARAEHTATRLADGRVLVTGGTTDAAASTAEIYDPQTGVFTPTGNMTGSRRMHTATLLPDGRVLIVGGCSSASAELYDPATGRFTATGSLHTAICGGSAALLADGRVLIAGGMSGYIVTAQAEVYDPATGTFSVAGPYANPGSLYPGSDGPVLGASARLADGRVLVTGDSPAEVFDPSTGEFRATGPSLAYPWGMYWQTTTALKDGSVLVAGGNDDWTCGGIPRAELFDPATSTFTLLGEMTSGRDMHTATLLNDGTVLLTGGGEGWCFTATNSSADVFDPASRTFTYAGEMSISRTGHTATLLNDGSVLVTGGIQYWPVGVTKAADIYRPQRPFEQ
jgi:hypothetical protein